MKGEQKVLLGVDNSEFARDAVAAAGSLLKDNENTKVTIFHGIRKPDLSYLAKAPLSPEELEKHLQLWSMEERQTLRRAKEAVVENGFDPHRVETTYEEECRDPVISMINLANREGFDTIGLARWGAKTLAQNIIGSVTYKLIHMAYHLPLWMIDPRIASHDVLVTIVGADISRRVVDHTIRYFSHLKDSRFTLFHVVPPVAPELYTSSYWDFLRDLGGEEQQQNMAQRMKEYVDNARRIAEQGRERLIHAGVPQENVVVKFQPQKEGIARDIVKELEENNHGILVLGRKGFKDINIFGLGSKADKLIHVAHALMICLVN
jgi:nucleotide-binding universal stress UspA family protein